MYKKRGVNSLVKKLSLILVAMLALSIAYASTFVDDTESEFDQGTYSNTIWDTDHVELESGYTSGSFTSQVFDGVNISIWNSATWTADIGEMSSSLSNNVLLMHMNEDSGTIIDSSGAGNDGTNNGATYGAEGKLGTALEFDGSNDYVHVDADSSFAFGTGNFTFMAWVKPTLINSNYRWVLDKYSNGRMVFGLSNTNKWRANAGTNVDSISNAVLNEWAHLAAVRIGSTMYLYVNGVLVNSNSGHNNNLLSASMAIGQRGDETNVAPFQGSIDELALFDRAFSAQEIYDAYAKGTLKLNLSVRSCNDAACSGESWTDVADSSPQSLSLSDNQYFQYNFDFETGNTSYSPELFDMTIDYTEQGQACTPSLANTSWSDWENISSCYQNNTLDQRRELTQYDANNCGTYENETFYEYQTANCTYQTATLSVQFVDPTPVDNETVTSLLVNATVETSDLQELKFNWDGTNCSFLDNAVLIMNFDEVSVIGENSSTAVDISGTGNDGDLQNGASYNTDSKYGKSVYFDGTDDLISVSDDASLDFGTSDFTVEFWIKRLDSGTHGIMSKGYFDGEGFSMFFTSGNYMRVRAATDTIDTSATAGATVTSADGWTHIAVTADRDGNIVFYKNGEFSHSQDISSASSSDISSTQDFKLAYIRNIAGTPYYSNAYFDELRVYKKVLSSDEITQHYNANFYKYDADKYIFVTEVDQDLANGTYTYFASVQDSSGSDSTETRTVNYGSSGEPPSGTITLTKPTQYVMFQRDGSNKGRIIIEGTYSGTPSDIEARFNGGSWQTIATGISGGSFAGNLTNQDVGQGTLEVRFVNDSGSVDTVSDISIGDIYAIAGQSNAEMRGNNMQYLNVSNAYLATVYREDDAWKTADDKVDTGTNVGSSWPLLANHIIQNANIPVAYISAARGGTTVLTWQKGQTDYTQLVNQISEGTYGTMEIKAILYYQGERDASTSPPGCIGSYENYKANLSAFASDILADTDAQHVVVGQIHYQPTGDRDSNDNIRKAQQDLWDDDANILSGPVTYEMGPLPDNLHFQTDAQLSEVADKWWAALEEHYYSGSNGRGPRIQNTSFNTYTDVLTLTFDKNLASSSGSQGWRITDGATVLGDANIQNSSVGGSQLQLELDTAINESFAVSLGSYNDGIGKNVPAGIDVFSLPAEMIFSYPISVDSTCYENLVNTSWSSWENISSCYANNTIDQRRELVQYDANDCGTYENETFYEYQTGSCEYYMLVTLNISREVYYNYVDYCSANSLNIDQEVEDFMWSEVNT